ncbi:serine/threonine-protein phosphatase [Yinghuangia sp. ASG 101]|uniref:PP2C family protein-serine/threonine phosphatase n=1 Tax=Yinghuangia sp. ASG 101 TaxID=2896848 RepID=UPI001E44C391|nr:PP2C family protein-serine/threonine phosphatase [Yinghuangia sp. ASG 101]UGQ11722.1 serine/threonine-protein phosphatase [Yinghuangia sp. ASG 101]
MSVRDVDDTRWDRLRTWSGQVPWVPPALLLAVGLLINLATPSEDIFTGAFAAAPLVAAALWSFGGTLATGVASLAAMELVIAIGDSPASYATVLRLTTIALVSGLSLVVNHALRHSDKKLASARRIAEAAQLAVLPPPAARVGGLGVAARYQAGHVGARIGGDLYAVQSTPYGVRMLVGDVRGKGLPAVDTVTVVLGAFREAAAREPELAATATWIEEALRREKRPGPDREEEFVTAVLAEVPAAAPDRVRVVNRGHPAPLLLSPHGHVQPVEPGTYALPLGLSELNPPGQSGIRDVRWAPGALLLIHTDGVTEARDRDGEFYDPVDRLGGRRFPDPATLLDTLLADVEDHTQGRNDDDMALLAVSYETADAERHADGSGRDVRV